MVSPEVLPHTPKSASSNHSEHSTAGLKAPGGYSKHARDSRRTSVLNTLVLGTFAIAMRLSLELKVYCV